MRIVMFYHSLVCDWNHGNAHFLRGVVSELIARGHRVDVYEPADAWAVRNLIAEHGRGPIDAFHRTYPHLRSHRYHLPELDLDAVLADADLVIAHEWNAPQLIARLGEHRAARRHYRLLFHDTHHRSASEPKAMAYYDLRHFDGVLAFGRVIADCYLRNNWARRVWVWHEAADTRVFFPQPDRPIEGELVWIGNWGDGERTEELETFLLEPVRKLGLRAKVFGVRYPEEALRALAKAGIKYGGWLPNYLVPDMFARYRLTVHVPRRYYVQQLPGIPTIRPFEAMACAMPLICSPWSDAEGLFTPDRDYLVARDAADMARHIKGLLDEPARADALASHGHQTVQQQHTCAHRVNELLDICRELDAPLSQRDMVRRRPLVRRCAVQNFADARLPQDQRDLYSSTPQHPGTA